MQYSIALFLFLKILWYFSVIWTNGRKRDESDKNLIISILNNKLNIKLHGRTSTKLTLVNLQEGLKFPIKFFSWTYCKHFVVWVDFYFIIIYLLIFIVGVGVCVCGYGGSGGGGLGGGRRSWCVHLTKCVGIYIVVLHLEGGHMELFRKMIDISLSYAGRARLLFCRKQIQSTVKTEVSRISWRWEAKASSCRSYNGSQIGGKSIVLVPDW